MTKAGDHSWVMEYFRKFSDNPALLMKYYHENAEFSSNGQSVSSKDDIIIEFIDMKAKVEQHNLKSHHSQWKEDSEAVIVNAWGDITFPGKSPQKFNQMFILVNEHVKISALTVHDH